MIGQIQQPLHGVGQRQGDPREPRGRRRRTGLPLYQGEGAEVGQPPQDGVERLRRGRMRMCRDPAVATPLGRGGWAVPSSRPQRKKKPAAPEGTKLP